MRLVDEQMDNAIKVELLSAHIAVRRHLRELTNSENERLEISPRL